MQKVKAKKVRVKKQGNRRGVYLIKGTLLGLAVFSMLLSVCAIIITKSDFESDIYSLLLQIIIPISAFISALFAGFKSKLKGITAGLLQTVMLIAPITLILFITNGFNIDIVDLLFVPISAVVGAIAGIISANIKR